LTQLLGDILISLYPFVTRCDQPLPFSEIKNYRHTIVFIVSELEISILHYFLITCRLCIPL